MSEGKAIAKQELGASYKIKDLGKVKLILGIKIDRDTNTGDI